jgi:hypothetical protein
MCHPFLFKPCAPIINSPGFAVTRCEDVLVLPQGSNDSPFFRIESAQLHGIRPLQDHFDTPASVRREPADMEALVADVDIDGAAESYVYFRIADLKPSQKKVISVAAGAGRTLAESQLAVTLHRKPNDDVAGQTVVFGRPFGDFGSVYVLDCLWDPYVFSLSLTRWESQRLEYTWTKVADMGCALSAPQVRQAITALVEAGAFGLDGNPLLKVDPDDADIFREMDRCGLVILQDVRDELCACMALAGAGDNVIESVWVLEGPQLFFCSSRR